MTAPGGVGEVVCVDPWVQLAIVNNADELIESGQAPVAIATKAHCIDIGHVLFCVTAGSAGAGASIYCSGIEASRTFAIVAAVLAVP